MIRSMRAMQMVSGATRAARASLLRVQTRGMAFAIDPMSDFHSSGDLKAEVKTQVLQADVAELATRQQTNPAAKANDPPTVSHARGFKYANLLYRASYSSEPAENTVFRAYYDLERMKEKMQHDADFEAFITNTDAMNSSEMVDAIDADDTLKALGVCDETHTLLVAMATDGKLKQLKDVINVYGEMIRSKLGVVSATLTTVADVDASELSDLATSIRELYLDADKKLRLEHKVDAQILGGFQVSIGTEQFYDFTAQTRLAELTQRIRKVGV